jgi:hypothetical protein
MVGIAVNILGLFLRLKRCFCLLLLRSLFCRTIAGSISVVDHPQLLEVAKTLHAAGKVRW